MALHLYHLNCCLPLTIRGQKVRAIYSFVLIVSYGCNVMFVPPGGSHVMSVLKGSSTGRNDVQVRFVWAANGFRPCHSAWC